MVERKSVVDGPVDVVLGPVDERAEVEDHLDDGTELHRRELVFRRAEVQSPDDSLHEPLHQPKLIEDAA